MVRYKLPVTLCCLGMILWLTGAMVRIMHWPFGIQIIWGGWALGVTGILIFMIRVWMLPAKPQAGTEVPKPNGEANRN